MSEGLGKNWTFLGKKFLKHFLILGCKNYITYNLPSYNSVWYTYLLEYLSRNVENLYTQA